MDGSEWKFSGYLPFVCWFVCVCVCSPTRRRNPRGNCRACRFITNRCRDASDVKSRGRRRVTASTRRRRISFLPSCSRKRKVCRLDPRPVTSWCIWHGQDREAKRPTRGPQGPVSGSRVQATTSKWPVENRQLTRTSSCSLRRWPAAAWTTTRSTTSPASWAAPKLTRTLASTQRRIERQLLRPRRPSQRLPKARLSWPTCRRLPTIRPRRPTWLSRASIWG